MFQSLTSVMGGKHMWKLLTFKYRWPVQKYVGFDSPPMTLFASRWYPLSLAVYFFFRALPGSKIITLHNEVVHE